MALLAAVPPGVSPVCPGCRASLSSRRAGAAVALRSVRTFAASGAVSGSKYPYEDGGVFDNDSDAVSPESASEAVRDEEEAAPQRSSSDRR